MLHFEQRADYDYDTKGNLIQYSKTNDVTQSFIWSDDDKEVIAEITSAAYGTTDASNKSVYYEYDDFGRLIVTRDVKRNIVRKLSYNHKKN